MYTDERQKQKQQQAENAEGADGKKKKKVTAAQLRVQRGISLFPFPSLYHPKLEKRIILIKQNK